MANRRNISVLTRAKRNPKMSTSTPEIAGIIMAQGFATMIVGLFVATCLVALFTRAVKADK